MINHNSIFRDQLRKIASAINKKHTILRKQIIKTAEVFQNNQLPIFPYQVCFGLFKHIIETASLTASLIFFPFLQNILNLGFANEEMSREIITLLSHIKSIPKFHSPESSSKLQTIIMLLVSKNAVNLNNLNYTHSIVNILFSLNNEKCKNLWMKSLSIINQIMLLFINQLKESSTQNNLKLFNEFLADIVTISMNQQPKWLIQIPEPFLALALLSQFFDQKYIKEHPTEHKDAFKGLDLYLRKSISKIIGSSNIQPSHTTIKEKAEKAPWQLTSENCLIVLMRVCCKFSKLYLDCFEILQEIIKIITEKGSTTVKFIGFESINFLFSSVSWMEAMLGSPNADLFNFLMTTLFNNAKFILSENRNKIDLNIQYEIEKAGKIFYGSFVDFYSFDLNPVIELKMIIKNVEEVSFTFYSIYNQRYSISMERSINTTEKIPLEKTYKFCQKTVFQISKALLPNQMPQDILQSLLKICEKFINLSGVFNDNNTSTMYMKLLCRYCLPSQFKNIGHRHVQINKMILNIANCLGNLFSTGCWAIVWKALENYTTYYNRYLLGKQELQAERRSDVEILYKSMDSIFTESAKYQNDYLVKILRSLIEVTYECLQNNFSADESKKIFAFERIQQIYKLNLFRIPIIWPELSSSLLCITTSKVAYFRLSSLNLLNTLVPITLYHVKTFPDALKQPMNAQNHENLIFQPWVNLAGCQFQEIKNQLAIAVNNIIIDYGHIMERGWKSILEIVKKTKDIKSLQAIVETYLDKISDNIMETINIIDEVERSLSDMNQKYLCLTLIWAIGDHCHKNALTEELRKIYAILLQPEQMFILGMQARHSSFYIFAQIIVHNCLQKQQPFWEWIFQEIQNYYAFALKKCLERKQSSEAQLKNIMANLIKIYRRLFSVAKQFETDKLVRDLLGRFFELCSDILQFRESQVYQMVGKAVKQMVFMKTEETLQLGSFWCFLQNLNQIYFVENDAKILKCLVTYLPNDIYEILSQCIAKLPERLIIIYRLLQKIFLLRLQAEQKDMKLDKLRIFFQQKAFLDFFKKMHGEVLKIDSSCQNIGNQNQQFIKLYLQNLIKTNHKLLLYEDYAFLQKMLPFVSSIVLKHSDCTDQNDVLELLKKIIYLKYDADCIKKNNTSKDIPVWYIASQQLIKQGYLYSNQKIKKPYEKVYSILSEIVHDKESQGNLKLIQQQYSQLSLPLFYQAHLEILNSLAECYFFNSGFQISTENISKISQHIQSMAVFDENDKTDKGRNSYDLLFKLSQKRQVDNSQQTSVSVVQDRQSIIIGHCLSKVQKSFQQYFNFLQITIMKQKSNVPNNDSEQIPNKLQTNNNININETIKSIQSQIKFVLKKLLTFQLKPNILLHENLKKLIIDNKIDPQSKAIKTEIGHLFLLHSQITKCIKSENRFIRNIMAEIMDKVCIYTLKIT